MAKLARSDTTLMEQHTLSELPQLAKSHSLESSLLRTRPWLLEIAQYGKNPSYGLPPSRGIHVIGVTFTQIWTNLHGLTGALYSNIQGWSP